MKRFVKQGINLDLNIDIYFDTYVNEEDISATTIKPIIVDDINKILDQQALSDFSVFVDNLFETIDYYDFEVLDDYKHTSKSFPYVSEYRWVAHRSQIDADNITKLIHLRVSDHIQKFSDERRKQIKLQYRDQANKLRRPLNKQKQRFIVSEIIVNNETFHTYEEALNACEKMIHTWLRELNVDMSNYGEIW